ncbi:hypothetical protein L6R29_24885 [Myxococcota bacterium]|nr:hypothetical protein [Myxococcota bacterium]
MSRIYAILFSIAPAFVLLFSGCIVIIDTSECYRNGDCKANERCVRLGSVGKCTPFATTEFVNNEPLPDSAPNEPLPDNPLPPDLPPNPDNPLPPDLPPNPDNPLPPDLPPNPDNPLPPDLPPNPDNPLPPDLPPNPDNPLPPDLPPNPDNPLPPDLPPNPDNPLPPDLPPNPDNPLPPDLPPNPDNPLPPDILPDLPDTPTADTHEVCDTNRPCKSTDLCAEAEDVSGNVLSICYRKCLLNNPQCPGNASCLPVDNTSGVCQPVGPTAQHQICKPPVVQQGRLDTSQACQTGLYCLDLNGGAEICVNLWEGNCQTPGKTCAPNETCLGLQDGNGNTYGSCFLRCNNNTCPAGLRCEANFGNVCLGAPITP